jgi:hypothetical protein
MAHYDTELAAKIAGKVLEDQEGRLEVKLDALDAAADIETIRERLADFGFADDCVGTGGRRASGIPWATGRFRESPGSEPSSPRRTFRCRMG